MKNIISKLGISFLVISALILYQGCMDLNEEIYSRVTPENFFNTEEEVVSALTEGYLRLSGYVGTGAYAQEHPSDEMVVPSRGTDWNENGWHRFLYRHTWDVNHDAFDWFWEEYYQGVSTTNRLIHQFENFDFELEGKEGYIAELRGLRAIFYWQLIDQFGNIPIVTEFDVPQDYSPANNSRTEVFNFIEKELLESLPFLSRTVGGEYYARINYYTAQALLAKLYMNAEVYTGTPMWDKAEAAMDEIIDSGHFNLTNNYYDNFASQNTGSPEFIFVIPYDAIFMSGFNYHRVSLHYQSQHTYRMTVQPWNGWATTEAFYNSYDENDVRKRNFISGFQFTYEGEPLLDPDYEVGRDPDGPHINFTPHIGKLADALRQEGARIGKWEIPVGTMDHLSSDFPIFRYADILLMKAEARFWKGETGGEALTLVNSIRRRAGLDDDFTELTAENLLAERGRELFGEIHRRTDQIRFGTFNDEWWEHAPDPSPHVNIYPIPRTQLDANPNLTQNPGY